MKKLNNYLRPSVKVRGMEAFMLDVNSGLGGTQLGTGKAAGPATPPVSVPEGGEQEPETPPQKQNLWEEE